MHKLFVLSSWRNKVVYIYNISIIVLIDAQGQQVDVTVSYEKPVNCILSYFLTLLVIIVVGIIIIDAARDRGA